MKRATIFLTTICLLLLTACATPQQTPIPFAIDSIGGSKKIGIAMTNLPKVQTTYPGAGCLLCLAAASVANSSLSDTVKTFTAEDITQVPSDIKKQLTSMGYDAQIIDTPLAIAQLPKNKSKTANTAKYDFSKFDAASGVEQLLVLDLEFIGIQRNYSSYIPTGAPQAVISGTAYMVDLSSGIYTWYKPLNIHRSAEGEWDEPPSFPGITNAFYQAVEAVHDEILKPLSESISNNQALR